MDSGIVSFYHFEAPRRDSSFVTCDSHFAKISKNIKKAKYLPKRVETIDIDFQSKFACKEIIFGN